MPNKVEKLPDGNWILEGELGERFSGAAETVMPAVLKSQQDTKQAYQEQKRENQTLKEENDRLKAAQSTVATPAGPQPTADQVSLRNFLTTEFAADLGLTPEQLRAVPAMLTNHHEALADWRRQVADSTFQHQHPDFPNTDAASEALVARAQKDFEVDIDAVALANPSRAAALLGAAHLSCINDKVYVPLTMDQQNQALISEARARENRPPPMIPGRSPDAASTDYDPWSKDVKLEDLRAAAIRQELEGKQR